MVVGIYAYHGSKIVNYMRKGFKKRGLEVIGGGCLCDLNPQDNLPNNIVSHPHDMGECYKRIKEIIETHPNNFFYIFAMGNPSRKEKIGEYANVKYIIHGTFDIYLEEILSKEAK